jgi:tRNA threonylcarbamoyladenosine biosynthesis protein TsaE
MSTVMTWQMRSTSSADTERLGELLGMQLKGGEVIELRSDLGGGKTTFVRGLARGIGSKNTVTSPTFTLNKIYKAKNGLQIHHFDFYRLDQAGVVAEQWAESVGGPKNIVVIEWSDIVKGVLPKEFLTIEFLPVAADSDERSISFNYPQKLQPLITKIESDWKEVRP